MWIVKTWLIQSQISYMLDAVICLALGERWRERMWIFSWLQSLTKRVSWQIRRHVISVQCVATSWCELFRVRWLQSRLSNVSVMRLSSSPTSASKCPLVKNGISVSTLNSGYSGDRTLNISWHWCLRASYLGEGTLYYHLSQNYSNNWTTSNKN